ncbi:MAG: hypothetical protein ACLUNZ_10030 [Evtepia sp.]
MESRNAKDPKLLALRDLCQRLAPENRVSLGGDAILLIEMYRTAGRT